MQTGLRVGGTAVDVTDDVLHGQAIRYSWGRRAEGSQTDPATASLVLRNSDGRYTGRNPLSPYYGQLGRNTPLSLTYTGPDVSLYLPSGSTQRAIGTDTAALDIVGDLDVRADLTPTAWGGTTSLSGWVVMGKWAGSTQHSWYMVMQDNGKPALFWSTNGLTSTGSGADVPVPFAPGQRGALRITLDVNNGLGGWTTTFYTAPTIAGPWTQLGTPDITTSGTTSIFSSTANLEVGNISAIDREAMAREYHAIEVRDGIGGSVVANPDFSALASGTNVWSDAAGRSWQANPGLITSTRTRAALEASSWTPRWSNEHNVTTPISAAGILRRLGQGRKPLQSTLRRTMPTIAGGPVAYWPLEDGASATQGASAVSGAPALHVEGIKFAADASCAGSSALPTTGTASAMQGLVPAYTSLTEGFTVAMMYSLEALPASKATMLAFETSSTAHGIAISLTSTDMVCDVYGNTGALLGTTSVPTPGYGADAWYRLFITAQRNGLNIDFRIGVEDDDRNITSTTLSVAGTPGSVTYITTDFNTLLDGMAFGHLAVYDNSEADLEWGRSQSGFAGEWAGERILRLCTEEGIPVIVADTDDGAHTEVGPQLPATLLDLLTEAEAADGGILYEDPVRLGFVYRARTTLYNQTPKLVIPYSQLAPPLEPTDDDKYLRNDRVAVREGGSSARAVLTSGALSTAAPEDGGVGVYDDSTTVNVYQDDQVGDIAGWLLHLGTWDDYRYPRLRILLHKYPELVSAVTSLRPGDIVQVTDPPAWLPPGPLNLMVEGGEDDIKTLEWTANLACSPGDPWNVGVLDDDVLGRLDTDGATLGAAATSTATSLTVHTTQTADGMVPIWTEDPADYPVDLRVGGEVVTATACAPLVADTFTRTVAAGGWGTASDGHTYTLTNGSASDLSVAATYGIIAPASSPATVRYQTVAETCQDVDIRAAVAVSATATGASLAAHVTARWVSSSSHYRVRVEFTTAGAIALTVLGSGSIIGAGSVATPATYTAGSVVEVRARIIGHRILARVWAAGAVEPADWHIDRTAVSSTITEGAVGLAGSVITGNTNVSPQIRFHDWLLETPQRITVTRSVNGIVKAQTAGTDVRLATPTIIAL
jgi:hypothetical protein